MSNALDIAARLRAARDGRAVRLGRIAPAWVNRPYTFVGLTLGGEDATLHAVRFGRAGEPPLVNLSIDDARDRVEQYKLFAHLSDAFFTVCREAFAREEFPQIIVANSAAAKHLAYIAERALTLRDADRATDEERARTRMVNVFGSYLTYFTSRLPIARQQALLTASSLLRSVYVTGESEEEEDHLYVLRSWIEPLPAGVHAFEYRAAQSRRPSGARTTTETDRVLMAAIKQLKALQKAGAWVDNTDLAIARKQIADHLALTIDEIETALHWAIDHYQALELPVLAHITDARYAEFKVFEAFMKSRALGFHIATRDNAKMAAIEYSYRSSEQQIADVAAVWYDPVARARAVIDGHVVRGTVLAVDLIAGTMVVRSKQASLRVRVGDRLYAQDKEQYPVQAVALVPEGIDVTCAISPKINGPQAGDPIDLVPQIPQFDQSIRARTQAATRLATPHWAYDEDAVLVRGARYQRPTDVLAELESKAK